MNQAPEAAGVEPSEEQRRALRELPFTTDGAADHISGVILYDETFRQSTPDGIAFARLLDDQGVVPGIKVDTGAKPLAGAEGEKLTASRGADLHAPVTRLRRPPRPPR